MEYNSESNWASDFKSAEGVARSYFQITSTITPELYDTKSCYQFIVSNKMQETLETKINNYKGTNPSYQYI